MLIIQKEGSWRKVDLEGATSEQLAEALLRALDWEVYALPESASDVIREPEISITNLLHHAYLRGELYQEDFMEWVSTDETHTMLVFGGSIIATVKQVQNDEELGQFCEIIRWFQRHQLTVTEKDV